MTRNQYSVHLPPCSRVLPPGTWPSLQSMSSRCEIWLKSGNWARHHDSLFGWWPSASYSSSHAFFWLWIFSSSSAGCPSVLSLETPCSINHVYFHMSLWINLPWLSHQPCWFFMINAASYFPMIKHCHLPLLLSVGPPSSPSLLRSPACDCLSNCHPQPAEESHCWISSWYWCPHQHVPAGLAEWRFLWAFPSSITVCWVFWPHWMYPFQSVTSLNLFIPSSTTCQSNLGTSTSFSATQCFLQASQWHPGVPWDPCHGIKSYVLRKGPQVNEFFLVQFYILFFLIKNSQNPIPEVPPPHPRPSSHSTCWVNLAAPLGYHISPCLSGPTRPQAGHAEI